MDSLTRIKICGITRLEDALDCVSLGIDALGFVFYRASKRYISPSQAKEIIQKIPPFITTVGLFVNASKEEVQSIVNEVPLQLLQFHADETEDFCRQFNRPYMKAIRMTVEQDFLQIEKDFASAVALLYDSHSEKEFGGTGKAFDWTSIPTNLKKPWVLAGGINPDNVVQAIKQTNATSIDVSSGVENSYGIKDKHKIRALVSGVKIARL